VIGFVLDASVALAWFLGQPVPAYAQRVRSALLKGEHAAVPSLWHLEMANGFAVSERRGILKSADVDLALVQVGQLLSQAVELSTEFVSLSQAFARARRFRLSAYDAVYLEVAQRLRLPLATLDRSLAAAAKLANVDLFR
jgi:predicted nucleic acid-binding protein